MVPLTVVSLGASCCSGDCRYLAKGHTTSDGQWVQPSWKELNGLNKWKYSNLAGSSVLRSDATSQTTPFSRECFFLSLQKTIKTAFEQEVSKGIDIDNKQVKKKLQFENIKFLCKRKYSNLARSTCNI